MARSLFKDTLLDRQGNALSGITVDVFNEGTTTPISDVIYSTDTGVGTLTNPFVISSADRGNVVFFLPEAKKRVDVRYSGGGITTKTVTLDGISPADLGSGGGLPSWFQSGDGSPVGSVTPSQKGALYQDTTNGALYVALGVTSGDWVRLGGEDGTGNWGVGVSDDGFGDLALMADTAQGGDAWLTGSGPHQGGVTWKSGGGDGLGRAVVTVYEGGTQARTWVFQSDLGLRLPGLSGNDHVLYCSDAIPSNSLGADGDWSLGGDGHIYAKAAGVWNLKV